MAETTRLTGTVRLGPCCLPLLFGLAVPLAAAGQDPIRLDSLEVLPDSVRAVFQDTTPKRAQRFPARLTALRGPSHEVFTCDRDCIHASTAFSLLELLLEHVPGLTGVRGGFFAGPHYAFDGAYGPGFGVLYIDGREILSLAGGQTDLRRLSLNYVERVRVFRGADGFVIDVDLIRHDAARAYSRIGGGTGNRLQVLEGIFANGLGRAFNVEGSFELLDVNENNVENDRFGGLGRISWMPRSNDFGVQLEFRTSSVDRTAIDTADVRRTEVVVRGRANLNERAQLEVYAQSTSRTLVVPGLPDSIAAPQRGADGVGVRLSTTPGRGTVSASMRFVGGGAYPSTSVDVAGWYPLGPLVVEAGAEHVSWNEFSTRSLRAGLSYTDTLPFPFTLRGFAAAGSRGVGFPALGAADSVGFDAVGASVDIEAGSFDLSGRFSAQRLDRQIGFGLGFDGTVVVDSSRVDVTSLEVRVEGPLIPIGAVIPGLEPIRVRAWWRRNTPRGADVLFLPDRLARVDLTLHDAFFGGNLEIWLTGFFEHRGMRLVPVTGSPDPFLLGADSWVGGHFMFKIGDFRFYWRFTNLAGLRVTDFPGAEFPAQVNMFGLRWEFFH